MIALIPIERDLTIWAVPEGAVGNYHLRVGISAFHLPLAALVILSLLHVARSPARPRGSAAPIVALALVWLVVCFAVSPTWRGVDALFHLVAAWAIWDTVRQGGQPSRRRLLIALCTLGAAEAALALAQRIVGGNLGVDLLEAPGAFYTYGPVVAVRGTLVHQYHFVTLVMICTAAVFVLLERGVSPNVRRLLTAEVLLLGLVVPMTFSRAVVLAVGPMLVVLVLRYRERLGAATLSWITGLALGAIASIDGVTGRATASVSSDQGSFDSGRTERLREALDIIGDHPFTGTGPGNYVIELQKDLGLVGDPSVKVLPSHNVIFHYAAEAGVLGGLLTLGLLAALAFWAVRGGALRVLVVLAVPPFLLLDLFPYTWQLGVVLTGLWLALAQIAGDARAGPDPALGTSPAVASDDQPANR